MSDEQDDETIIGPWKDYKTPIAITATIPFSGTAFMEERDSVVIVSSFESSSSCGLSFRDYTRGVYAEELGHLEDPSWTFEDKLVHHKLDVIDKRLQKLSEEHREIHADVRSSRELFSSAARRYPLELVKVLTVGVGGFSFAALLLGKLLNRTIIAPDLGLLLCLFALVFWLTASVRSISHRKTHG